MPNLIDLTGKKIGRLTVMSFAEIRRSAKGAQYFWLCRCDCGKETKVDGCCLRRQSTTSCGCKGRENHTKHGMAEHPLYTVWLGIKQRCLNPNSECYHRYGGRGVTICDRWKDSFGNFYSDMGDRPTPLHTIERIENGKGYEPGNCKWATRAEQNENTSQTRLLTHDGVTLSVGKWAKRIGVCRKTITSRIDRFGWSIAKALTTPAQRQEARKKNFGRRS